MEVGSKSILKAVFDKRIRSRLFQWGIQMNPQPWTSRVPGLDGTRVGVAK